MKLENYEVHLPSYSIGDHIYDKIGPVCESYGKTVLLIGGRRALKAAEEKIRTYVAKTNLEIIGVERYGSDCTYETVEKLRQLPVYHKADMVFGVGGGKALDTVKCLCITDDKPVFTFPTIASNCAACTSVSIMYNEDGTFLKPNFFVRPAMHAFIDTEIIAKAPAQYMWAGIGDTYAKYYEATISSRGEQLEHFTSLGVALSVMCRNPLLEYGAKALEDHKKGLCTYDVEQVVLAIVVTTGIASIFLTKDFTPDYNSGLAHAIFYQLLGEVETRSARTLVLEPGAYPSALVLANFKDKDVDTLLDLMKQAQVNIPLKAVVTPANRSWVFGDLLAHLQEEHTAFTAAKENQTR